MHMADLAICVHSLLYPRLLIETAPIPGIASRIYMDTNHMNRENDNYQSSLRRTFVFSEI
jgi:hypothetical protein